MKQQTKICQNCKQEFIIEPEDFDFYEKINVPPPTFCPECRFIRRLMARNERSLYLRKCDLCKKEKIMMFPADSPYTIYCYQCWWSDNWDPMDYSRDYNFSRPFFEQYDQLLKTVPRPGIIKQGNIVDSEYTNRVSDLKNCYLIFGCNICENCMYGSWMNNSNECIDCYNTQKCEKCYECVDCILCYNVKYSQECNTCNDSAFLYNCRNCHDCFGCVNLRGGQYNLFNKQLSKQEYKTAVEKYDLNDRRTIDKLISLFQQKKLRHIMPNIIQRHSDNYSGNWLDECRNIHNSFNCGEIENGRHLFALLQAKDVMDYCHWGRSTELIYEAINVGRQCTRVFFANECWDQLIDGQYCMNCHSSQHLFGCIGVRKKQYCIFNKQYSETEYQDVISRIISHMNDMPYIDKIGRVFKYGEFFPPEILPFAYNEAIVQEFFPNTQSQAKEKGFRWRAEEIKQHGVTKSPDALPNKITDVDDSVLQEVIGCAHMGKCIHQCTTAFKIVPQELQFYRKMNIPLPKLCSNCRHYQRLKQRNPLKLWHRRCQCSGEQSDNKVYANTVQHSHKNDHCPNEFQTTYAPERPEIVYCEQCYQSEIL